eukprot:scaffold302223_cov19-Tisochrysis_lutea.AAC.1
MRCGSSRALRSKKQGTTVSLAKARDEQMLQWKPYLLPEVRSVTGLRITGTTGLTGIIGISGAPCEAPTCSA